MVDLRPIAYVLGRILTVLAGLMLLPAALDYAAGLHNASDFVEAAIVTGGVGSLMSLATANALGRGLDTRQAYLLTVAIWSLVPLFGALPFYIGAPHLTFLHAYFEAVSGITTTGSTMIAGLDGLPAGMNLWRGMLNWLGGLGIAFVAMIFLPVMRVGGMQFFRTEGFDTMGKALPRATDIAFSLMTVYAVLTLACVATYRLLGMTALDAVVHGMATVATGGFSTSDLSFQKYPGAMEYAGALFMVLSSLPYIRFVQLMQGTGRPVWRDAQVPAYLRWIAAGVALVVLWRVFAEGSAAEPSLRVTLFNLVSVISGTGFSSGGFTGWGSLVLVVVFVMGMIGGCSGSSSGALSVFRVQVMLAALRSQVLTIRAPDRVAPVKYDGRTVEIDVMNALMMYLTGYVLTIGVLSVGLTLVSVDPVSALFTVWSSLGNIGYGIGPIVGTDGTYAGLPPVAVGIVIVAMLMGRLGLLAVLVLALPRFWRR